MSVQQAFLFYNRSLGFDNILDYFYEKGSPIIEFFVDCS